MTQPLELPDANWADREPATEFWPVSWVASFEHDQLIAAGQILARSLAELAPSVEAGFVIQVGAGRPAATWIAVRSDGVPDGSRLVSTLLRSLLPWLGCDPSAAVAQIPDISPTVGLTFSLRGDGGDAGPVPFRSQLLDVLGRSAGRWQLTIGTGLAVDSPAGDDDDLAGPGIRFDTSISLIGTGAESRLAATLLALDISTPGDPVQVTARPALGDHLRRLVAQARAGIAAPGGFLDPVRTARLLSIPLRLAADRPRPPYRPVPPEATARLFRDSVPPHILILGGSGQGKTTLLHHAAMDAARSGESTILVLSPHGDLVVRLAESMARENLGFRVLHFGADDPLRWNIMQPDPGVTPGEWATWLARIIKRLWPEMPAEFFGPVWERVSRIVLEVLIADPAGPHPITDFPAFFERESEERDEALARLASEDLARSVREELVPFLTARDAGNAAVWILAKIEGLVGNPAVARVVGTTRTEVDLEPTLHGAHTIVYAPLTRLGDDGSRLLGSVLIDHLWRRAQQAPPSRPLDLYIDEWHRLATPAVGDILAEGRKFGFRLRLANQNASQVPAALWDTTLGNVGAVVSFRTGPRDAALLDSMFPTIGATTLTQLPRHWVAVTTGTEDHVGTTEGPLPGSDDPGPLQQGHERARRAAGAAAADVGTQLCLAFSTEAAQAAKPGPLEEWLHRRRLSHVVLPADDVEDEKEDDEDDLDGEDEEDEDLGEEDDEDGGAEDQEPWDDGQGWDAGDVCSAPPDDLGDTWDDADEGPPGEWG